MKFKYGWVENKDTRERKDVVTKFGRLKDVLNLLIGGGSILLGVAYIAITSFKTGVGEHERAEFEALSDLGLISEPEKEK